MLFFSIIIIYFLFSIIINYYKYQINNKRLTIKRNYK